MRHLTACVIALICGARPAAQVRLADESDRAAFRAWFVLLADAQFERPTPDVTDCAALVRHAFREALRAHTPEWVRRRGLAVRAAVRRRALGAARRRPTGWPLFRVTNGAPPKYAEFADARTLDRAQRAAARPRHRARSARRPALLPSARPAGARSPDGVRRPVALRSRRRRLGRVSHRAHRRRPRRSAQGPAVDLHAASGAALAPARLESATSSASSGWPCYERCPRPLRSCSSSSLFCLRSPAAQASRAPRTGRRSRCRRARSSPRKDAPNFYLTFRRIPQLDFRVYKVRDPFAFFAGLDDPHQLGSDDVDVPQERTLARADRRLEARAAPVRAALRARAGQPRLPRRAARRHRQGRRRAARRAERQHLRAGAAAQSRSGRHVLARAAAEPSRRRSAARAGRAQRSPASTSSKPSTTCCAPTRS